MEKLEIIAPITFTSSEKFAKAGAPDFEILAYTGRVLRRNYGHLVINTAGIEAKSSMPILRQHDPGEIVGYTYGHQEKNGAFLVTGRFSKTTKPGREVAGLAREGFPWQASLGILPSPGGIANIREGETATVNGMDVKGPITLWKKSKVLEISFVTLAADSDTKVAIFDGLNEEPFFDRSGYATQYHSSPALQAEFGDVDVYLAYLEAERQGLCSICK